MSYLIDLNSKVAIVTGAYKGIGKEIARIYTQAGAQVVINDIVSGDKIQPVLDELEKFGKRPYYIQSDMSTQEGAENIVVKTIQQFGQLDILVNNAGIVADWDKSYDLNVKGVYYASNAAKIYLEKTKGRIIILTSESIFTGGTGIPQYVATKGGAFALVRFLAREYAKLGIRVNGIAPAVVMSDMLLARFENEEVLKEHYKNIMPLGEIGSPEDIAGVALFLSCKLSDFICGEVLIADGGRMHIG